MSKQQIGVVGMAVMGRNLALNIESRGYTVSVFNRSREKTEEVIAENPGKKLVPHYTVKEFVESLETPRRILLMVKAGAGTDSAIDSLKPYLDKGDIIIDGGNTFFQDTIRRNRELSAEGFNFIGTGVSGGEEGALKGPSIMPGGQKEAYELVAPILEQIAARAEDGEPCVAYIGADGAGHYVKMVPPRRPMVRIRLPSPWRRRAKRGRSRAIKPLPRCCRNMALPWRSPAKWGCVAPA